MDEILTKDKKHLTIFESNIVIDKRLLKWRRAEDGIETTKMSNSDTEGEIVGTTPSYIIGTTPSSDVIGTNSYDPDRNLDATTKWLPLYETPEGIKFDELATAGIRDLTRMIVEKKLKYVMAGYGSFGNTVGSFAINDNRFFDDGGPVTMYGSNKKPEKSSWFDRLLNFFGKKENKEEEPQMDALKFFSLVKTSSKESAAVYKDRVSKYLHALHNATNIGQTVLQEELIRGLVTNRYESVLFAEGYYYAITENQIVDFAKKCEKGIKLSYLKNFNRPIPQSVIDKVAKLNNLEVFDNYVVLYYDPEGKVYKETAKEEAKRRDPIIFGVIAGSKKLYYVDDWVDEYCDLTLDAFVDSLGITKDDLHFDAEDIKKEKKEDTKKKKKSKK